MEKILSTRPILFILKHVTFFFFFLKNLELVKCWLLKEANQNVVDEKFFL